MSSPLTLILKVQPKNAEYRMQLYARLTEKARKEEGTITYRMFRAPSGATSFYEDYVSSEAFLDHFGRAQSSGVRDEFMAAGDVAEVLCFGTPTPEAREVLAKFGATWRNT